MCILSTGDIIPICAPMLRVNKVKKLSPALLLAVLVGMLAVAVSGDLDTVTSTAQTFLTMTVQEIKSGDRPTDGGVKKTNKHF